MHLSLRQIHFKAFCGTKVIVWCIWVFRGAKYCNRVATKCQYFSPSTLGADLYVLQVGKLYEYNGYTEGYLWNESQFCIYNQNKVRRKLNSHKFQAREIKAVRMKSCNIFSEPTLEVIQHAWSPICNSGAGGEEALYAMNTPTVLWKQELQEKAGEPGFWFRIEPLQFNFSKQTISISFHTEITWKCKFAMTVL